MAKKIVKVEDKKNNTKIDLVKIKDVIVENKDTIEKIVDIAGDLLNDNKKTKKSTKKTTSKSKKTSKSKSNDLSKVIDIAGALLKK